MSQLSTENRTITVNGIETSVRSTDDLNQLLADARKYRFLEIWIVSLDGRSMCALVNNEKAWLMYLREDGDPGFSSRNSEPTEQEQTEQEDELVDFRLANGQMDKYPVSWTIDTERAFKALEHFLVTGDRDPGLFWHDDSEVG